MEQRLIIRNTTDLYRLVYNGGASAQIGTLSVILSQRPGNNSLRITPLPHLQHSSAGGDPLTGDNPGGQEDGRPQVSYYNYDHLGNTRILYHSVIDCGTEEVHYVLEYVADYYPFGSILREWENCEKSRFLFTYKERDAETGWDNLGARMYDSDICRFFGVDPIADKFPHVNSYNYAENEPVANIDLHGLQKFYVSDGRFVKQIGKDNTIRILPAIKPGKIGLNYKNLSAGLLNSISLTAQINTKENRETVLREWAGTYQGLSNRYSNDIRGNREFGMALYSKELINEDGSKLEVFVKGETIEGEKGVNGISMSKSKSPFEDWNILGIIHSHRWGDDPSNFSDDPGIGGEYLTGDIQTAIKLGITSYLVVPYSKYIGSFDPNRFQDLQKSHSSKISLKLATNGKAIKFD